MGVRDSLDKFDFGGSALTPGIPEWLSEPLWNWFRDVLVKDGLTNINWQCRDDFNRPSYCKLSDTIRTDLQLAFRAKWQIPKSPSELLSQAFSNVDIFIKLADYMLQHYGNTAYKTSSFSQIGISFGELLESILSRGGSAYASRRIGRIFRLEDRVPKIVVKESQKALSNEEELDEAWSACYGQTPDYNKTVQKSQTVLERILKDNYLPDETRAQLGVMIGKIRDKNSNLQLTFTGSKILDSSNDILKLIEHIAKYRGIHTVGTGEEADKEIATYILHTTIYFWNLYNGDK